MMSGTWLKDILIITLFTSFLYFAFLGARPLTPPDEGRYSEIPREMVVSGDYVTPHLNGIKYFEKPALFYWMQSFNIKLFGVKEWSLRLANAIMGILGCLITYFGTRKLYNRRIGILASLILASSLLYAGLAHFITLDMTVTTFLTGCFLFFLVGNQEPPGKTRKYYMWLMYVCAALATLTKGLIGALLPGMVIFVWLCISQQWRQLSTYYIFSGTLIFLMITLPWHIAVQIRNPEFFHFYVIEQHFLRYLTNYASRKQPIWFFPCVLVFGLFPWSGFLFPALKSQLSTWRLQKGHLTEKFLLLWIALIFVFYWISHSQLAPYILPIFPPLAMLLAKYFDKNWEVRTLGLAIGFIFALTLFSIFSIGALIYLYHMPNITLSIGLILTTLFAVFTSLLLGLLLYWNKGLKFGMVPLLLGISLLTLMVNITYSPLEARSVKILANKLQQMILPDDQVYTYHDYFQDLPVYLQQKVTIVNYHGELEFGSEHQNTNSILATDVQLWQDWKSNRRNFMIIKLQDYDRLSRTLKVKFYPIAKTSRNILVSNQEIKK